MRKNLRYLEAGLLAVGLTLLAAYLAIRIHGSVSSRVSLRNFAKINGEVSGNDTAHDQKAKRSVDFALWSDKRIATYKESISSAFDTPIAVLTIPALELEVPVFEGTEEPVLNRGAGRIFGTAKPGEDGNIGIAGHRDGFFRCLKDIHIGDQVELATPGKKIIYMVDAIEVVLPEDVAVLQPRSRPSLTLVTCYPFYFVGSAPKRYIVHASVGESELPDRTSGPSSELKTTK
jgi:sortase A